MLYVPPVTRLKAGSAEASRALLRMAGLRPTRQRLVIAQELFSDGPKHLTADELFQRVRCLDRPLSLATVYNTLNQFAEAGLIRRVAVNGGRTYFDTDSTSHNHFYVEGEDRLLDVEDGAVSIAALPAPPLGYVISEVDVLIRLRRSARPRLHQFSARSKASCHETD